MQNKDVFASIINRTGDDEAPYVIILLDKALERIKMSGVFAKETTLESTQSLMDEILKGFTTEQTCSPSFILAMCAILKGSIIGYLKETTDKY